MRQRDSIFPYLFVVVMEVLSDLLERVTNNSSFKFHKKCQALSINHLCFIDDLILFCIEDGNSIRLQKRGVGDILGLV